MAFDQPAAVWAKDDRARPRVKQSCQTFAELGPFLFAEELEERRSEDGGDVPP